MKTLTAVLAVSLLALGITAAWAVKSGGGPGKYAGRIVPRMTEPDRPWTPGTLDVLYESADVPVGIRDLLVTSSNLTISDSLMIADLNVRLDITHTWLRDLSITLQGPNGDSVVLLDLYPGDFAENMDSTWLNDESTVSIRQAPPPMTGRFRPQRPLSAFNGLPAAGTWTLHVLDRFPADTGSLQAWALEINGPVALEGFVREGSVGLPGVRVDILTSGAMATTDSSGWYSIDVVPADTFDVQFVKDLFDTLHVPGVVLLEGIPTRLDTMLASPYALVSYFSRPPAIAIPDTGAAAAMSITVDTLDSRDIVDLDVIVTVNHGYVSDLSVRLAKPGQDTVALIPVPNPCLGVAGANLDGTRFDDEATRQFQFAEGQAPYAGSFRPADPLSMFDDDVTAGTWTLLVQDHCPEDSGTIEGFSLHILIPAATEAPRPILPRDFVFHGNYPNPFNSQTEFRFDLAQRGQFTLILYNTLGQEVARVVDGVMEVGSHTIAFDARDLASGLYFARASAGNTVQTRKLVLLR